MDLSIQEQTQRYKKYLDELDKIRLEQLQQVQQEQDRPIINEYDNLNWLIQRRGQGVLYTTTTFRINSNTPSTSY